ncbi:MAG: EamA family transporter [Steroidobacterales bacterium]
MTTRPPVLHVLLAFAGIYLIWGTTFLAIALVIRTLPPFVSGGIRFLIAGALMYAWLRSREPHPFAGLRVGGSILCGVLLTGMGNGLVVWSQQGLPSGIAALFVGAMPVSILVLDWVFFSRRTPALQAVIGVAIGLLGVVILSTHTRSLSGAVRPIHVIAVLTAELAWSVGTLLQRRYVPAQRVINFTCLQMLVGGVFQSILALIDHEWPGFDPARISLQSVLALMYLVVFGSLIAVNCYSWLIAHVAPQKVTTYALVNPVIALALGALLLGERITPAAALSTALVLLGVGLVLFQRPRAPSVSRHGCRERPGLV